jgi:hypothetical protein
MSMKKLLVVVAVLIGVVWWVRRGHERGAPGPARPLVFDRIWIDRVPTRETDIAQVFLAITEEPIGLFNASSRWKGEFELFRYEPRAEGELQLLYPQTQTREKVRYQATECDVPGFHYCLELQGASRGVRKYYSQRGWEIGSVAEGQAKLARLRAR